MKTIGSKIRFFREEREMTQTDLAKKAKVAPAQISEYESGKAIPKIDKIIKIANALNVNANDIDSRLTFEFCFAGKLKKEEPTTMTRTEIAEIVEAVVAALEKKSSKNEPAEAKAPKIPASRKTQEQRDMELIEYILREVSTRGEIGKAELLYRSHARNRDFSRAVNMLAERGAIKLSAQILQIGR